MSKAISAKQQAFDATSSERLKYSETKTKKGRDRYTVSDICDSCHDYIRIERKFLFLRLKGTKILCKKCWLKEKESGCKIKIGYHRLMKI